MVEVFKTNVKTREQAEMLLACIHARFSCRANFDLQDCDNILRVEYRGEICIAGTLISILRDLGFYAEVLPDQQPVINDGKINLNL